MIKFDCVACKKDITDLVQKHLLEGTETEDRTESMVCPECYEKGHSISICQKCQSQYHIEPMGKLQMVSAILGDKEEITINNETLTQTDLINKSYMFIISSCPDCTDNPEEAQILSVMPVQGISDALFTNTTFPDSVIILHTDKG